MESPRAQKYWWVNHKQTSKEELDGGYIWSPKTNANGARNQTYDNLLETAVGDLIFSYADTYIRAVGVVAEAPLHAKRPGNFEHIGPHWNEDGWMVRIDWTRLHTPCKPRDYISLIAELLPVKYAPLGKDGKGLQSCYLAQISRELFDVIHRIICERNADLPALTAEIERSVDESALERHILLDHTIPKTEQETLIKARIGQGIFRYRVGEIETCCRVTDVHDRRFLVASHIRPWSQCADHFQRLDGNNGLFLSPHIDKLFDGGWISFKDNGELLIASREIEDILAAWNVRLPVQRRPFHKKQQEYLAYHRETLFARRSETR